MRPCFQGRFISGCGRPAGAGCGAPPITSITSIGWAGGSSAIDSTRQRGRAQLQQRGERAAGARLDDQRERQRARAALRDQRGDALADHAGEVGLDHRLAGASGRACPGRSSPSSAASSVITGSRSFGRADAADDQRAQIGAQQVDQPVVVERLLDRLAEAGEDRQRMADRDAVLQQRAQQAGQRGERQRLRVDRLDQRRPNAP